MSDIEFLDSSRVTLINSNATDDMVAMAAWVSNSLDTEDRLANAKRKEGLINFLLREKHMSPFEHGIFTFKIETPIFVAREFMRHRTMSFNEMSGRYTEMRPKFYVPNTDRPIVQEGKIGSYNFVPGDDAQQTTVVNAIQENSIDAWNRYMELKSAGIANEVARDVLPVNIFTEFYASVDPRNLMHFLSLRTEAQALYEIREVAGMMEEFFAAEMPFTYKAWKNNVV